MGHLPQFVELSGFPIIAGEQLFAEISRSISSTGKGGRSMRTLFGRKLRILAMPPKRFGKNEVVQDWDAALQMSEYVGLTHAPQARIVVEECTTDEVAKLGLRSDARMDPSMCLEFHIQLDRHVLERHLRHAREVISSKSTQAAVRNNRELRGVVFAGELYRDFKHKVLMLIVAAHIADPTRVSLGRLFSDNFDGRFGSEAIEIPFVSEKKADELDLRKHNAKEVYDFIENAPGEIGDVPQSQLMMGLSYLSHTFQNGLVGSSLTNFVWALAAIEAMLSTPNDKANIGILEPRLRALLGASFSDTISGSFREIYKYRNAVLHGNVALPLSFDSRNIFGYEGVKNSNTMPFEFSQFTYCLAVKILQRFFELRSYNVRYESKLRA